MRPIATDRVACASCLQCFDTVGWAAGRASGLQKWGDGGGGHWLVRMEWRPAGWSVCLPLLIFRCTIKSRSSLLAPAQPGGPEKGPETVVVWCGGATDRVAWSVCLLVSQSLCHDHQPRKSGWTDRDTIWVLDSGGLKQPCIRWGPLPPHEGAILREKTVAHCRELSKNSCTDRDAVWDAKSGESMESCIGWGAHWHNLANTTEPSVCGDAALSEITVTTCCC